MRYFSLVCFLLLSLAACANCHTRTPFMSSAKEIDLSERLTSDNPKHLVTVFTEFDGQFTCDSSPAQIAYRTFCDGSDPIILSFNDGKDYIQANCLSLLPDKKLPDQTETFPASILNTAINIEFSLTGSHYNAVRSHNEIVTIPAVMVSDITGTSPGDRALWKLKQTEASKTWLTQPYSLLDDRTLYVQPLKIIYQPLATTCAHQTNQTITLPAVTPLDFLSSHYPGLTPFNILLHCHNVTKSAQTNRGMRVYLASDDINADADSGLLIDQRPNAAKNVGVRIAFQRDKGAALRLLPRGAAPSMATALFTVRRGDHIDPIVSIPLYAYYGYLNGKTIKPGLVSVTAFIYIDYD